MPEISPSKFLVSAGWDSVPHLSEEQKTKMLRETPVHLRDARSKGIPSLGQGAIYPIAESEFVVPPFKIPAHFVRGYGMDVGWNRTAAAFMAWDRDQDIVYVTSEHYRGQSEPSTHAAAILARGDWMPGFIDPAANGRSVKDGEQLMQTYLNLGLRITPADHAVEAGILDVFQRLATGRLKVFATCVNWLMEYRIYRRDKRGHIVKANDHLMDCFTGDTLIATENGPKRIEAMVGIKGRVFTTGGRLADFEACRRYGENRPIVLLTFDDGSMVRATPDHLFKTDKGWIKAIDLAGMRCDTYDVSHPIQRQDICPSLSSLQPSKSLRANDIISAGSIFREMEGGCISQFGAERTAGSPPRAGMFTTATRIAATISRAISNFCELACICLSIKPAMVGPFPRQRFLPQRSGTAPKTDGSGIASITLQSPTNSIERQIATAISVEQPISPLIEQGNASAQTNAERNLADYLALTMFNDLAELVGYPSLSTDIPSSEPAPAHAGKTCVSVVSAGRADVYCLTVPETSTFLLANGVEVHNCTRYGARDSALASFVVPPATGMIGVSRPNLYR